MPPLQLSSVPTADVTDEPDGALLSASGKLRSELQLGSIRSSANAHSHADEQRRADATAPPTERERHRSLRVDDQPDEFLSRLPAAHAGEQQQQQQLVQFGEHVIEWQSEQQHEHQRQFILSNLNTITSSLF